MPMEWWERYGPWALVTGASSGLGAEFTRQLAAREMNVVLVARRTDRMETLAREVGHTHGVQTRIITADLTQEGACESVAEASEGLEIGLLVNNAGFGMTGPFSACDALRQARMVVLNCVVPVFLTAHFLPPMLERNRGGLIFLASTAAYQPTPFLATYGATKAFNLMLGESLWAECRRCGVHSLALSPGFTQTEFGSVARFKDSGPFREATPPAVVRRALQSLGSRPSVVHGLLNKLLPVAGRLLPRRAVVAVSSASLEGRAEDHSSG